MRDIYSNAKIASVIRSKTEPNEIEIFWEPDVTPEEKETIAFHFRALEVGDEIWWQSSKREHWAALAGSAGYALHKADGKIHFMPFVMS